MRWLPFGGCIEWRYTTAASSWPWGPNPLAYVNRSLLLVRALIGFLYVAHSLHNLSGKFCVPRMAAWTQAVAKEGLQPAA